MSTSRTDLGWGERTGIIAEDGNGVPTGRPGWLSAPRNEFYSYAALPREPWHPGESASLARSKRLSKDGVLRLDVVIGMLRCRHRRSTAEWR